MDIIDIINAIKNEHKITNTEFADRVGVKPSQVTEWLNGKAKPGYKHLKAICKAFDISGDFVLGLKK